MKLTKEQACEILGVPPNASKPQIKAAFLLLAQDFHPDHNPGQTKAEKDFWKEVQEAYEFLCKPNKKKDHILEIILAIVTNNFLEPDPIQSSIAEVYKDRAETKMQISALVTNKIKVKRHLQTLNEDCPDPELMKHILECFDGILKKLEEDIATLENNVNTQTEVINRLSALRGKTIRDFNAYISY